MQKRFLPCKIPDMCKKIAYKPIKIDFEDGELNGNVNQQESLLEKWEMVGKFFTYLQLW